MNIIIRLFNRLSILSYKSPSNSIAQAVALTVLCVVFLTCWWMASAVEKKLVFTIDEVELGHSAAVTIGNSSDVCFQNVPHDFLTITPERDGFRWEVNKLYHDSLQYFKINNENPNKHVIRNDASQQINIVLPVRKDKILKMSLTGEDVWQTWNDFKDQKDVLVKHFAAYYHVRKGDVSKEDSLLYLSQMQRHDVRSFFERDGESLSLIILDEHTHLHDNGSDIGYARSGLVHPTGEQVGRCKVQFFRVADYCYMERRAARGRFQINGVSYAMKPTVKLTEWGAGHVMIDFAQDHTFLRFPRPITYVGSVDSLRKKSAYASQVITLKQDNNAFPAKSDLYLPAFSTAVNFDLCNIEFFHQDDSVVIRDNHYREQVVENPRTSFLPFSIVPTFEPMTLRSGQDTLNGRVGWIDGTFIFSYLWPSLLVFVILLLLIWIPAISPVRLSRKQLNNLREKEAVKHYPSYLSLLLLIALGYCVCKSLIALKLSYTYPYFEKITGIVPVSAAMTLLLFFSLTMILNSSLRQYAGKGTSKNAVCWIVCACMLTALVFLFFKVMDSMISAGVISSYFHSEVYNVLPWRWLVEYGINDTHRSVVYALFVSEAVVLTLWLLLNIFGASITTGCHTLKERYDKLVEKINGRLKNYWGKATYLDGLKKLLALPVMRENFLVKALFSAIKTLFPTHFLVMIVLIVIGNKFGNFGTAFITLLVILGFTQALTHTSIEEGTLPRHTIFCKMLLISAAYIVAAMMGDHGYMTNYLGFVMCLLCFFFMMRRPVSYGDSYQQAARTERRWVNKMLLTLVVIIVFLPTVCSHLFTTEEVNYDRLSRRVMLYSNFDSLERSGYRYSESDAEFMVIMSHYMQDRKSRDPLSNDDHFLHASVSSGQSPVVLNDLSLPVAFFGSYGVFRASVVYFLLLFVMIWMVMQYSFSFVDTKEPTLNRPMQWRLLAMFMWVGTSLYIYLSYIDWLPFTGRLNPGLGVDAVGEALETAILLAFMASVGCNMRNYYKDK